MESKNTYARKLTHIFDEKYCKSNFKKKMGVTPPIQCLNKTLLSNFNKKSGNLTQI